MIKLALYGKIAIVPRTPRDRPNEGRTEAWECVVQVNERALFAGRDPRRLDVDRQVHGYGNTPAEAIAHARKTMSETRRDRAFPRAADVGRRYGVGYLVALAHTAQAPGSGYPEWRKQQAEKRSKPGVGPCESCGDVGPLFRRPRGKLHLCKACAEGSK